MVCGAASTSSRVWWWREHTTKLVKLDDVINYLVFIALFSWRMEECEAKRTSLLVRSPANFGLRRESLDSTMGDNAHSNEESSAAPWQYV